jgi:pimeloyl-ACP methyl ester carboxylesterase
MFKFVDRSQTDYLVLIPGWAFDYKIFATLDLPYNYFHFCDQYLANFEDKLKELLAHNNIKRISLFGWSQGAFAACNFASKNPSSVEELILVSARKKYEPKNLQNIKKYISKNKAAYLYSFYRECFCKNEKDHFCWLKNTLLKDYLGTISSSHLVANLDYLSQLQIQPELIKKLERVKLVHGTEDKIAPINEAADIANALPQAQFICFEHTGHLPFLQKDFSKRLYES